MSVRKHRAPKGALRRDDLAGQDGRDVVRKHRAPNGALRLCEGVPDCHRFAFVRKHRAPKGALRLISRRPRCERVIRVRKHRAPKGALRLGFLGDWTKAAWGSESTERQKVH